MVINRDATIRWKGYDPNDLSIHSKDRVWLNCDRCGNGRWGRTGQSQLLCRSCTLRKRFEDPAELAKHSAAQKKRFEDPREREKESVAQKKTYIDDPSRHKRMSDIQKRRFESDEERYKTSSAQKKYWESPEAHEKASAAQIKRFTDPLERENSSIAHKILYANDPTIGHRQSATMQGQNYDAGEWTGHTDKSRPHLLPINQCIKLNQRFPGSDGHHITPSVVVFVPEELHDHVKHDIRTGNNMGEINMLATQYITGWW